LFSEIIFLIFFRLPAPNMKAMYENGILKITLPHQAKQAENVHSIKVE